jgi:hypothetical protein
MGKFCAARQVLAMTNLVAAYQQNDIMGFERILRTNKCAVVAVTLAVAFAAARAL